MTIYHEMIQAATGRTDPKEHDVIETCMRDMNYGILSDLWPDEFTEQAKLAAEVCIEMGELT